MGEHTIGGASSSSEDLLTTSSSFDCLPDVAMGLDLWREIFSQRWKMDYYYTVLVYEIPTIRVATRSIKRAKLCCHLLPRAAENRSDSNETLQIAKQFAAFVF
jgi:hypothetical protein